VNGRSIGRLIASLAIRLALTGFALAHLIAPADAQSSQGSPNSPPAPSDAAIGKLLDTYGMIAGGWYIEKRCNHLADLLKKEFDWNVAQTTVALGRAVKADGLRQIQQAAKKTADAHACGKDTEKIVISSVQISRQTTHSLTGQTYSAENAQAYDRSRLVALFRAQTVDDRCKLMPPEIRKEFDERVLKIGAELDRSSGSPAAAGLKREAQRLDAGSDGCNADTQRQLMSAVAEARQITAR
jgi:hypothetical protein